MLSPPPSSMKTRDTVTEVLPAKPSPQAALRLVPCLYTALSTFTANFFSMVPTFQALGRTCAADVHEVCPGWPYFGHKAMASSPFLTVSMTGQHIASTSIP